LGDMKRTLKGFVQYALIGAYPGERRRIQEGVGGFTLRRVLVGKDAP